MLIFIYLSVEIANWCYRFEKYREGKLMFNHYQTKMLLIIFGSLSLGV